MLAVLHGYETGEDLDYCYACGLVVLGESDRQGFGVDRR